ncbi:hypothetical protein C8Q80DRAFT_1348509 [Daedaleopsis nitida]|nr:hypothetical protein C8Q80DRAFT_1348509 [Daedaleopsis nitida]
MAALQTHLAIMLATRRNGYAAFPIFLGHLRMPWHGCLGNKFVDKARLLKHLWKHASVPLLCPYEGCNEQFDEAAGQTPQWTAAVERANCIRSGGERAVLSALPGVVPAYMERHQWLGARVLENIVCFKWQGRRSNAAVPSRGARRLAEKIAAAELAGSTPGGGLAYVRRLIDDEYLNFADGYSSGWHTQVYEEVPSAEVSQMVTNGLVLFAGDGDGDGDAAALSVLDATTSTGDHADSHPGASNEPSQPRVETSEVIARAPKGHPQRECREGEGGIGERLDADGSPPATSGTSLVLRLPSFKYSTSTVPQTTDSDMVVSPRPSSWRFRLKQPPSSDGVGPALSFLGYMIWH